MRQLKCSATKPLTTRDTLSGLTPEQLQAVQDLMAKRDGVQAIDLEKLGVLRRSATTIYVTVIRRNNQVVLQPPFQTK